MLTPPKIEEYYKNEKYIITYNIRKEIIIFGDTVVEKHKFYQRKNPISIHQIDISKIFVSRKFPSGKKVLNIL